LADQAAQGKRDSGSSWPGTRKPDRAVLDRKWLIINRGAKKLSKKAQK
jgi:hypothetical protein